MATDERTLAERVEKLEADVAQLMRRTAQMKRPPPPKRAPPKVTAAFGDGPGERKILDKVSAMLDEKMTVHAMVVRLNEEGVHPRTGVAWTVPKVTELVRVLGRQTFEVRL